MIAVLGALQNIQAVCQVEHEFYCDVYYMYMCLYVLICDVSVKCYQGGDLYNLQDVA